MRKTFASLVLNELSSNDDLVILTGDLGYKMWDEVRTKHPSKFYNVGSAEQLLLGAGIGLALSGKIPILYSITPFLLYRPFELIRNYMDYENIPVKIVGSGRDRDYSHDGISHWAEDDKKILSNLANIKQYHPDSIDDLEHLFTEILYNNKPCYVNLRR